MSDQLTIEEKAALYDFLCEMGVHVLDLKTGQGTRTFQKNKVKHKVHEHYIEWGSSDYYSCLDYERKVVPEDDPLYQLLKKAGY